MKDIKKVNQWGFTLALSAILVVLSTLTSCYRMPTNDDYSLIPATNNPDFTGKRNQGGMPSVPY